MARIEWVAVRDPLKSSRIIGAVGFIDNVAAMITAFYDDADADRSGSVSWGEYAASKLSPVSLKGKAVAEVAMAARTDPAIMLRDQGFAQMSGSIFTNFAAGMVMDGVYAAYFSRGVSVMSGGVAKKITASTVKGFVIKKGLESTVKAAFGGAVGR